MMVFEGGWLLSIDFWLLKSPKIPNQMSPIQSFSNFLFQKTIFTFKA